MKNCKECEHYEFYNGPERKSFGNKVVMICHHPDFIDDEKYHFTSSGCSRFTPKKPVEKSCQTCGAHRENNGTGKACYDFLDVPIGNCTNYSFWQPIKPDKPKAEVPEKEAVPPKESCLNCKHSEREADRFYCKHLKRRYSNGCDIPCDFYKREKTNPPNSKEKTMSRMKKRIRQFVIGCTLYCTAAICIALNPWLFKLAGIIKPSWTDEVQEKSVYNISGDYLGKTLESLEVPWDSGDIKQVVAVWCCVLVSIAAIALAIHVFNYITAYVFGKLEK